MGTAHRVNVEGTLLLLELAAEQFSPFLSEDEPSMVNAALSSLSGFLSTIEHNLNAPKSERFFQRQIWTFRLRPDDRESFRQAMRKQLEFAGFEIESMNGSATLFGVRPALADIAVGAHCDEQAPFVGAGQDVLGPVMVHAGRQLGNHFGIGRGSRHSRGVSESHNGIGVRDVQVVADQRHAEGRVECRQERRARLRDAIADRLAGCYAPGETIDGVAWYNDSKATTPAAACVALGAFDRPVLVIAGGYDKKIDLAPLADALAGYDPDEVSVTATPTEIIVKADHESEEDDEDEITRFSEFHSNRVYRRFELPAKIRTDKVEAKFKNGLLKIEAEKLAETQTEPKRIDIQTAA